MIKEDFNNYYEQLCHSYGIRPRPEQAKAWFRRCSTIDPDRFLKAVEKVVEEDARFPSLSRLLTACANISTDQGQRKAKKEKCAVCDGYGFVRIGLEIFSGCCVHGARLQSHRVAPLSKESIFAILRKQEKVYDEIYGEGHWQKSVGELRRMAQSKCLPDATWI